MEYDLIWLDELPAAHPSAPLADTAWFEMGPNGLRRLDPRDVYQDESGFAMGLPVHRSARDPWFSLAAFATSPPKARTRIHQACIQAIDTPALQ